MENTNPNLDLSNIRKHKLALMSAIDNDRSIKWTLRLWGRVIKARDLQRCVSCGSVEKIQAHHIVRKTLYPWGAFQSGNGITLCLECHDRVHSLSNLKADLSQPIGEGDDQDDWAFLFGLLRDDAVFRGLDEDEFYYIDDDMMEFFVRVQGYEFLRQMVIRHEITRIHFAYQIWLHMPENFYKHIIAGMFRQE